MREREVSRVAKFQYWLEPEGLTLLEGWARDGLTEEQIAHNCGINRASLTRWKKRFPEFAQALRKGREVVDYEVENALLKRALGYEYTEVTREETDKGEKRRETVKLEPPNVTALLFWLKTRRPDKWQGQPQEQEEDEEGGVVVLPEVNEELGVRS